MDRGGPHTARVAPGWDHHTQGRGQTGGQKAGGTHACSRAPILPRNPPSLLLRDQEPCLQAASLSMLCATKHGTPSTLGQEKMARPMFQQSEGRKSIRLQGQTSVVWRNSQSASQQQGIIFTTVTVLMRLVLPVFNLSFLGLERNTH